MDFDNLYRFGNKYVGELGRDLVHHCYLKSFDKLPTENPEGYIHRVMINELRSDSKFKKQYNTIHKPFEVDGEYVPNDLDVVYLILDELVREGFKLQVNVFLELNQKGGATRMRIATGARYKNLIEIRKFVLTEIKNRYEHKRNYIDSIHDVYSLE